MTNWKRSKLRRAAASTMAAMLMLGSMPAMAQTAGASDSIPAPPSLDAGAQETPDTSQVTNGAYILTFKNGISKQQMKETIHTYNGTKIDGNYKSHIVSIKLANKQYDKIKQDPVVDTIEKNQSVKIQSQDSMTQYSHKKTKVPQAWQHDLTGENEKIAVLDTGISDEHRDLDVEKGTSTVNYTDSSADDNGHGTHVSGIIAANNNDMGVTGVASDADLYPVKVLNADGEGNLMDVIEGIDWAIKHQMDMINISSGTYTASHALKTKLDEVASKGILIVASAGNSGDSPIGYPAKYNHVIAVGATDKHNQLASFSSRGPNLDVVAPGKNIVSTYLDNDYAKGSGTSQAAPYITGMLALLQEQHPDMSAEDLTDTLYASSHDLGAKGQDTTYGRGLVQYPDFAEAGEGQAGNDEDDNADQQPNKEKSTQHDSTNQNGETAPKDNGENSTPSDGFPDVTEGETGGHYKAIMTMSKKDAIKGKPDGRFYPWEDVKRGQMTNIIQNLRHFPVPTLKQVLTAYDDINKHNDYAKSIATLTHANVLKGDNGHFGEYDNLTREQMATILNKAFSLNDINEKKNNDDADVYLNNVDPSHKESVQILANLGITTELDDFRPYENVTRAQVATFLDKVPGT
ncbi:hypothetical protein GCM10028778_12410 [Barrientosiimonas marina]|uniref:S8 family serine peptidase n=1 Tax=Lentibacillus kimchii TaxID=1542911 RepID=A0ABW2UYF9_9BACI